MPNKIPLETIKNQLPSFVQIVESSYRGTRYPATFIDTDYNETFEAIPRAVIKLQHGCKSRSNKLRSEALKGIDTKLGTPIEFIKSQLPDYLEIVPKSYTSIRSKANFYDKEYKCYFQAYVFNVLREGKGYCQQRENDVFRNKITRTSEDIQNELDIKYPNMFILIPETYKDTNSCATFINLTNNKQFSGNVSQVLTGRQIERNKELEWKVAIKERDGHACQCCQSKTKLVTHHLYAWKTYPDLRFNLDNGITLCADCHNDFHSRYGKGEVTLSDFTNYLKEKSQTLSSLASELELRFS